MFFGLLLIGIGIFWILKYLGIIPANFDLFWPILFIVIGLSIVIGKLRSSHFGFGPDERDKHHK
jgi:predicted ABC-type exoprotein transport system permease subunit